VLKKAIDPNALPVQLVRIYDHWCTLGAGKTLPSITDFNQSDLKDTISHTILTEVLRDGDNHVCDFVFRMIGSYVADRMPQVYTGEALTRLPGKGPGSGIWSAYMDTVTRAAPLQVTLPYEGGIGAYSRSDEIFLPFARSGQDDASYVLVGLVLS